MRWLSYYRQFEGMSDEEVNARLREDADRRRARALARIDPLDLSETTWHELPHPHVVNAVTYALRRGMNRHRDPRAEALRDELAKRTGAPLERIAVGNGVAQLIASALATVVGPGDEIVSPWPSYALYPGMAHELHATFTPLRGFDPDAMLEALGPRARALIVCNPNDPTGDYLRVDQLADLLERLPDAVTLLVDEALVEYVDVETPGASLELLERSPRILIFRTFSKVYGLAALRCGYVVGGRGSEGLLGRLQPPLGINELSQVGALEALQKCDGQVEARRRLVIDQRPRLLDALAELPVEAHPSQANFLWLCANDLSGAELAGRLERSKVTVRRGTFVGDERHVRATIQGDQASDRLLEALHGAVAPART